MELNRIDIFSGLVGVDSFLEEFDFGSFVESGHVLSEAEQQKKVEEFLGSWDEELGFQFKSFVNPTHINSDLSCSPSLSAIPVYSLPSPQISLGSPAVSAPSSPYIGHIKTQHPPSHLSNPCTELSLVPSLSIPTVFDDPACSSIAPFGQPSSDPDFIDISPYARYPMREAAKKIKVPCSTLGKRWKAASMGRQWPYRKVRKIEKEIETLVYNMNTIQSSEDQNRLAFLIKDRYSELRPVFLRINNSIKC